MDPGNTELAPMELDRRAYRFFPKREDQKTVFEKKGTRYFFYGQIEHDEYQLRKLKEFHEYVKTKGKKYDEQYYDEHRLLLFLSANKYKPKETLKAMLEHLTFIKEFLPTVRFERVQKLIQSGFFYPCGRDYCFRPLIVFNARLLDPKDIETSYETIVFVHEQIKKHCFLPGQVQSWNVIYDLSNLGLTDLPLSSFGKILEKISLNYGGRLYRLWVLNAPGSITVPWGIVSAFLDKITVEKIKISKQSTDQSIFQLYHPSQVEERFGGKQKNRNNFWPFLLPPAVVDQKRLVDDGDYLKLLETGKLSRNTIDPKFAKKQ